MEALSADTTAVKLRGSYYRNSVEDLNKNQISNISKQDNIISPTVPKTCSHPWPSASLNKKRRQAGDNGKAGGSRLFVRCHAMTRRDVYRLKAVGDVLWRSGRRVNFEELILATLL